MNLTHEINLKGSAENAWEVLGLGYGNVCEWTSTLSSSVMEGELGVGGTRVCVNSKSFGPFKQGLVIKERLTLFDPETKTFAYEALTDTLPPIIKKAENKWSIREIDDQNCIVYINANVEFKWPFNLFGSIIKWLINRDIGKLVEELKYRIEHNAPHPDALNSKVELAFQG